MLCDALLYVLSIRSSKDEVTILNSLLVLSCFVLDVKSTTAKTQYDNMIMNVKSNDVESCESNGKFGDSI